MAQGTQTPSVTVVTSQPRPDVVVINGEQYYLGCPLAWPRRKYAPEDANRLDNCMVEFVALDGEIPSALLRSMVNGQTARVVGYAGGSVIFYSPVPVAKIVKDANGNDIEEYPLPENCIRQEGSIVHKKFAKK
jgi:hypothetical protein